MLMILYDLPKEKRVRYESEFPAHIMCRIRSCHGKRLIEYTPFENDTMKNSESRTSILVELVSIELQMLSVVALDTALHFLRACKVVDPNFINDRLFEAKTWNCGDVGLMTHGITASTDLIFNSANHSWVWK